MNAQLIIHALMHNRDRYRRNLVLPNYTPAGWWECDVFEMTPRDFFREYEVKVSRSDFFADAKKERERYQGFRLPTVSEKKHDLLSSFHAKGPTAFWYVCPAGLVTVDEVPSWAGLIECEERGAGYEPWQHLFETKKDAPILHREKADPDVRRHAEGVCYWRMHHLLSGTVGQRVKVSADDPAEAVA